MSDDQISGMKPQGRVFDSIVETIGGTPLIRMARLAEDAGVEADILGK